MSELVFSKTLNRVRKTLPSLRRTLHYNARTASPPLLGPPEIYKPSPTPLHRSTPPHTAAADPFMDLMVSNFNKAAASPPYPPRGFTENNSPTYLSSGNPCVDFFFHVVPDTPSESIQERVRVAWDHDAVKTMKLICNLRGVRGTGKSDKEGFYTAALWLHALHPKTLACNIGSVADFGYFKDLPEILYRLLEGSEIRKIRREEWDLKKQKRIEKIMERETTPCKEKKRVSPETAREIRILNAERRSKLEEERARGERYKKYIAMAKKLLERYNRDPDFKYLHDRISDHFADRLKADLALLASGDTNISLAAKWCPSIDSAFDRSTLLCESIARRIFNRESYPEYDGVEEAHYAYRIRDRLRKEVLVPLRKALELPAVYIGAGDWKSLPYNRVSSLAMRFYEDKFMVHDRERFVQYLADVRYGKATIAAGALLPHQIIGSLGHSDIAELQWNRMVEDMLKLGKLKNCIAVCDVSGSMAGEPMAVCVALGLLLSELSEDPWKGKVITFHQDPKLQLISGSDLYSKTDFIREMEWGGNTDFQKVFDLILNVAVAGKLKPEQMIKRIFVFSDMEFDEASRGSPYAYPSYGARYGAHFPAIGAAPGWETDYEVIQRKYKERGYGSSVPEIVFWNLRESEATPVTARQKGVALVSGFSKNLMKLFLENDGDMNPEIVMDSAIAGPEYQKLAVID